MNDGRKDDSGKLRFSLVPIDPLRTVVRVLMYGADRYGPDNWMRVENGRTRYYDAAQRHLTAWWGGEANDADTGLPHLAHAICCGLFLLALDTGPTLAKPPAR